MVAQLKFWFRSSKPVGRLRGNKFSSGTFSAYKMTHSVDPEMKSGWELIGEKSFGIVVTQLFMIL